MEAFLKTLVIASLLLVILLLGSCSDDDDRQNSIVGKYELYLDGNLCAEGTTSEVGIIDNTISLSKGEVITILLVGIPQTVGESIQTSGYATQGSVSITGKNLLLNDNSTELYMSVSGTVTRESGSKISFEGICSTPGNSNVTHTFSGSLESDAYKVI